jgi:hypothetical protein
MPRERVAQPETIQKCPSGNSVAREASILCAMLAVKKGRSADTARQARTIVRTALPGIHPASLWL